MKILKKEESREICTESGWYAFDYILDRNISDKDILSLEKLGGSLIYLTSLTNPFFKIEDRFFMLKGIQGKNEFRLSFYAEMENEICHMVEKHMESL